MTIWASGDPALKHIAYQVAHVIFGNPETTVENKHYVLSLYNVTGGAVLG